MKVLSGLGALSEWVKPTEIYCTSEGCIPSVLLWSFFFFSAAFSNVSLIKVSLPASTVWAPTPKLAVDPRWPLGTAMKGNQVCIWKSHMQPSGSICNCIQPHPAILHLRICYPPPRQLPVRQAAIGQNTSRTRLMHSTWIKDLVAVTCRYRACTVVNMSFSVL